MNNSTKGIVVVDFARPVQIAYLLEQTIYSRVAIE